MEADGGRRDKREGLVENHKSRRPSRGDEEEEEEAKEEEEQEDERPRGRGGGNCVNQGRRRPVAGRRLLVTSARPTSRGEYQELLNIFISSSFCVTVWWEEWTFERGSPSL